MTIKFMKIGYIVMLPTRLRTHDQGQNQTKDELGSVAYALTSALA
jgi:hypothetical protein